MIRPFAQVTSGGIYLLANGSPSNFSVAEMTCRCGCGAHQMDQAQITMLQAIRLMVGEPVHVNSGVRCWRYHLAVYAGSGKEAPADSQHIPRTPAGEKVLVSGTQLGASRATDITVGGVSPRALRAMIGKAATALGVVGMGAYPGFTHVDTRDGKKARW